MNKKICKKNLEKKTAKNCAQKNQRALVRWLKCSFSCVLFSFEIAIPVFHLFGRCAPQIHPFSFIFDAQTVLLFTLHIPKRLLFFFHFKVTFLQTLYFHFSREHTFVMANGNDDEEDEQFAITFLFHN